MQMVKLAMMHNKLLVSVMALAFLATPALAKEELLMPPAGDNATESVSEAPTSAPDPAMAMATASASSDSLGSFGPSSGTVVGNRALELRDEVLRLRTSVNLNSNEFSILRSSGAAGAVQYHSTVAAITARLQNGTTRGNPILLRQWEEANSSLDEVTGSLNRLNSLQTSIDADASLASYLLDSTQAAFQLSGAVDEDHDQLKLLRDEVSRLVVQLDYLRNQTTNDIQRQTTYLTTERSNLQALAFAISRGELLGSSLNRAVIVNTSPVAAIPQPAQPMQPSYAAPMPQSMLGNEMPMAPQAAPQMPVAPAPGIASGPAPMSPRDYMQEMGQPLPMPPASAPQTTSPQAAVPTSAPTGIATANPNVGVAPTIGHLLVLIRYNQPVVDYAQQLSQAVNTAIERHPDAEFSVVAVSPSSGDPADLAKAQESAQRNAEEVKRSLVQLGLQPSRITMANTQAQTAQLPEVHVYVR